MGLLDDPLQTAQEAGESYYDSEMERWEETKDDPVGTFTDSLRFGLTGPAPSLNPDGTTDFGNEGGPLEAINTTTYDAAGGDSDAAATGDGLPLQWIAAGAVVLVLLYLSAPLIELATALTGD